MKSVDMQDLPLSKEHIQNITLFTDKEKQQEIDYLADNLMAEKTLNLRIGTIVMCISNLDVDAGIINGSQGIVVDFQKDNPLVKFNDGNIRVITPHIWQSEKLPAIAVQQLPLIYAWAITIHKAQGVTLDKALIDIGEEIFECGQTYVALSRIKTLEGLYLKNFDFRKIKVNKKVKINDQFVTLNPETAFGPEIIEKFEFNDVSLQDLTKHMQKLTGINLIIDIVMFALLAPRKMLWSTQV